jgi:polygalacturonase
VREFGYGPNADGIDVEHSRRVLIEDSRVRCGDDAICLKAGFAPSELAPTADVVVRNNTIHTSCPHVPPANKNDGCGGMKLGYG